MNDKAGDRYKSLSIAEVAWFVFQQGVLKYGLPLTASVQVLGYFVKYGVSAAHLSGFFAPMNIFLFLLTVLFEGILFAWIVWNWGERRFQQLLS